MDNIDTENNINKNNNESIKLDKELKRKQYLKEYREKNKEKIKNYESKKYGEKQYERIKKSVSKNSQILKIIKEAVKLNKIFLEDEDKFNQLKLLLK